MQPALSPQRLAQRGDVLVEVCFFHIRKLGQTACKSSSLVTTRGALETRKTRTSRILARQGNRGRLPCEGTRNGVQFEPSNLYKQWRNQ